MQASELIRRALRLINVPGRGSVLSDLDLSAGLEALQDLLDAEATSTAGVPGIRTHFFNLSAKQFDYSYGPGGDFDTDDFADPLPVRVEDAFIRASATITRNEQVTSWSFLTATGWTPATGWTIANGKATIAVGNANATLTQTLGLIAGTTYVVRVNVSHRAGAVKLEINQDSVAIVDQDLDESGEFAFTFTFSGTASEIEFTANAAGTADLDILDVSILEENQDRLSLSGPGSDYPVQVIDQERYNRRFTKGVDGRPYQLRYDRNFPLGLIRFDNAPSQGDVIVMDVLVNRLAVDDLADTLRVHPSSHKFLRYKLADELAGEYGKELTRRQQKILQDAENKHDAANHRDNTLGVDIALRQRRGFDINRGDP